MLTALDIAISHITPKVDVHTSRKVPMDRPETFIRVDQGTPFMPNPITETNIVFVQVYGEDLEEVLDLIGAVRELLQDLDMIDDRVQGWAETEGPHEYPDPDLQQAIRWQLAGELSFTHL